MQISDISDEILQTRFFCIIAEKKNAHEAELNSARILIKVQAWAHPLCRYEDQIAMLPKDIVVYDVFNFFWWVTVADNIWHFSSKKWDRRLAKLLFSNFSEFKCEFIGRFFFSLFLKKKK